MNCDENRADETAQELAHQPSIAAESDSRTAATQQAPGLRLKDRGVAPVRTRRRPLHAIAVGIR